MVVMLRLPHRKLLPHANGDVEPTKTGDGVASLGTCKASETFERNREVTLGGEDAAG